MKDVPEFDTAAKFSVAVEQKLNDPFTNKVDAVRLLLDAFLQVQPRQKLTQRIGNKHTRFQYT